MATRAPPYAGAAPPVPNGIHPQQWANGQWQYNPNHDGNQAQWAAAPAWNGMRGPNGKPVPPTVQNPFQIQAKAPSAAYLGLPVDANALGMLNMQREKKPDGVPKTPWIWNPRSLAKDPTDEVRPIKVPMTEITRFREEDRQLRAAALASPPEPPSRKNSRSSAEAPPDDASRRHRSASRGQEPPVESPHPPPEPGRHEPFTGSQPLRPTFSRNIMRTPQMHKERSESGSIRSDSRASNTSSTTIVRPELTSASSSQRHVEAARQASMPNPTSPDRDQHRNHRQSSLPANAMQQGPEHQPAPAFRSNIISSEPQVVLSPLIPDAALSLPNHRPRRLRGVARAATDPTLGAIRESTDGSVRSEPSRKHGHQSSESMLNPSSLSRSRQASAEPEPLRSRSRQGSVEPEPRSSHGHRSSVHSRTRSSPHAIPEPEDIAMDLEETYLDGQNRKRERSGGGGSGSSRAPSRTISRESSRGEVGSSAAYPTRGPADDNGSSSWPSKLVYKIYIHDPTDERGGELLPCHVLHPADPENTIPPSPGKTRVPLPLAVSLDGSSREKHYKIDVPIPPGGWVVVNNQRVEGDPLAGMEERPPVQREAPSHYKKKVRQGYWNRRGDHRTAGGSLVYAPQYLAYPSELAHYPKEEFYDAKHDRTAFVDSRYNQELSSSLPRRGQPARYPYEKWVVYTWIV